MDINFSKEDLSFREEVRDWLENDLIIGIRACFFENKWEYSMNQCNHK